MTHQNGTAKVLPHGIDPRDLEGSPERISTDPSPPTHHERVGSEAPIDAHVTNFVARTATLNSRWSALNWTWGFLVTMLIPAVGSIVWYGLLPVTNPLDPDRGDKALFVFLVHPASMTFLSYLLCSLFHISIDSDRPNRPIIHYFHILATNYVVQVLFPGLYILFERPFKFMALPALALVFFVTLVLIRLAPKSWIEDPPSYWRAFHVFKKVSITFFVYMAILAGYTIANVRVSGTGQGFLTFALAIIGFIFKKILLAFTDPIWLESAMLISGFWIEHLTDVFIVLAFPSAEDVGTTFAIIFTVRVVENLAYLWFQLDIWFKFRIWIKGKFKDDQKVAIEEDLPEYADDRGHSAHHPGYRRRQLRFLVMKIFSQLSAYVYFLTLVPVLRYGPNNRRFPFSEVVAGTQEKPATLLLSDTLLDESLQFLVQKRFVRAMYFAAAQIVSTLLSGLGIWLWMHKFHPNIILSLRKKYNAVVVNTAHYGLVLNILLVNCLIGTSFVNIYYRIYFV